MGSTYPPDILSIRSIVSLKDLLTNRPRSIIPEWHTQVYHASHWWENIGSGHSALGVTCRIQIHGDMSTTGGVSKQDNFVDRAVAKLWTADIVVYPFSDKLHVVGARRILNGCSLCFPGRNFVLVVGDKLVIGNHNDDALLREIVSYIAPILYSGPWLDNCRI